MSLTRLLESDVIKYVIITVVITTCLSFCLILICRPRMSVRKPINTINSIRIEDEKILTII